MARNSNYTAGDIEVLEGLEPVRRRPGMYIGGTEGYNGLHHLVTELLDNAVDEAMNGHADEISLTLHADGESISVEDNGRGIPVDVHPKFKKPALEIILTTLHSGGKFTDNNYVSAGGLHGVGASVVNALSEELRATVSRDGYEWSQSFARGKPAGKLVRGEKTKRHGTRMFFRPDSEIFKSTSFSAERLEQTLQEKAFLNRGITFCFTNEKNGKSEKFCYKDGIASYLQNTLTQANLSAVGGESFFLDRANGIKVEVAFCWTENTQERILSYVNGIHTRDGGTHEDGLRSGLSKALRNYCGVHDLVPKGVKVTGEDMREGLIAILSVNVPGSISQLQFQGQTKDRLNNPEVSASVEALIRNFENSLNSKPTVAAQIVERVLLACKARAAARVAAEGVSRKVGVSHRLNLPGKLADCSSTSPEKSELFIVEGDSAGGSAKQGRDRATQAVMPLRGKVLNAIAASDAKLKDNRELLDLISVLGCGFGEQLRLEKLRYAKVIILTDADSDGMHIAALLMAFFYKFMKELVKAGNLYIGLSPLYRIKLGSGSKEETHWVYSDEEKDKLLKGKGAGCKIQITRFKGLGEMNPKTLWETTLNPRTRNLLKVRVDDDADCQRVLESLLGKDASERYRLIQENAHRLELDL